MYLPAKAAVYGSLAGLLHAATYEKVYRFGGPLMHRLQEEWNAAFDVADWGRIRALVCAICLTIFSLVLTFQAAALSFVSILFSFAFVPNWRSTVS